MKNNTKIWAIMILQAFPIPLSLVTILGSVISLANIGAMAEQSLFVTIVAVASMILSGTYTLTYIFAAVKTFINKKISAITFLPLFHIVVTIVFFALWIISG